MADFMKNGHFFWSGMTCNRVLYVLLVSTHCHENYTHLDWIEVNECCHMVISSLLNVSVLTSECELKRKFQHISALMIEYISTHDRIQLQLLLVLRILKFTRSRLINRLWLQRIKSVYLSQYTHKHLYE